MLFSNNIEDYIRFVKWILDIFVKLTILFSEKTNTKGKQNGRYSHVRTLNLFGNNHLYFFAIACNPRNIPVQDIEDG